MPRRGTPRTKPAPPLPSSGCGFCTSRGQSGHAHAVEQIDFFVERHFFQHHGGALVGREFWIHPGMVAIEFFAEVMALLLREHVCLRRDQSRDEREYENSCDRERCTALTRTVMGLRRVCILF